MAILINTNFITTPSLGLRAICQATFVPSLLLFILHGVLSHGVNPALGLIPLAFSALVGAVVLFEAQKSRCNCEGLGSHPAVLIADALVAAGLLLEWILTLVFMDRDHWPMLGTYCTNFLIINFGCHVWFVLKHCFNTLSGGSYYPKSCPRCHYAPFSQFRGEGRRLYGNAAYQPLIGEENYGEYQDATGEQRERPVNSGVIVKPDASRGDEPI